MNITKAFVDSLQYTGKDQFYSDDLLKGFAVRVRRESISYIVTYRNSYGKQRRITLGQHPVITPAQARLEAKKMLALVMSGHDPQDEKGKNKHGLTVADLVDEYYELHVKRLKPSSQIHYSSAIRLHIKPLLGKMRVRQVKRHHIQMFYNDLVDGKILQRTPNRPANYKYTGLANMAMRVLIGAFDFALDKELIEYNPCIRIKHPVPRIRQFFLDDKQITQFGELVRTCPYYDKKVLDILVLLALTGCRKQEISQIKWEYIDLENQVIHFPDTKTGPQDRPFGIAAKQVFEKYKTSETQTGYVFMGKEHTNYAVYQTFKNHICNTPGFEYFIPHGLRHTYASMGAKMGYSDFIIAGILGHKLKSMTSRYTHMTMDTLVPAADRISCRIARLMNLDLPCLKEDVQPVLEQRLFVQPRAEIEASEPMVCFEPF